MHFLELIIFDISIVIALFGIVVFCLRNTKNKSTFIRKNKCLISAIAIFLIYVTMVGQIYPEINDFMSMRRGNFQVFQGLCYEYTSSIGIGIVTLENEIFIYDTLEWVPKKGRKYYIKYLPETKYIIRHEEI